MIFELWARWCVSERGFNNGSIISRMMENKEIKSEGYLYFDCLESNIEKILSKLYLIDSKSVDVIRFEYVYSIKKEMNQTEKAKALNLSVSTYQRRLSKAKKYVIDRI